MPDFERLIDSLHEYTAKFPEQKAWAAGYSAGKSRARIEMIVLFFMIYLCTALVKHLIT